MAPGGGIVNSVRLRLLTAILLLGLSTPVFAGKPSSGTSAPVFHLPTRDGAVSLDSLQGKVACIDFWASWCGPCKQSFPWMKSLHERFAGKGLVVVAINLDRDRKAADEFLAKYPAPFTVAFDPSGKTAKAFRVWGMPTSYILGPTGAILSTHAGFDPKRTAMIESEIAKSLPQ